MMRLRAIEPDLAVCRSVAEHDGAVRTLGRDLEEVGHKFRIFAEINAAKAWNAASAMRVDMEKRNTVLHGPLQGAADRVGTHHCTDACIEQIFVVAQGPVLAR